MFQIIESIMPAILRTMRELADLQMKTWPFMSLFRVKLLWQSMRYIAYNNINIRSISEIILRLQKSTW